MGIIQRQGIKATIVNFVGVVVGAISLLFIYPLDDEFYGYILYLYNTALLLVPFASLGILSIIVKFYPRFKNNTNGNNGFLTLIHLLLVIGLLIFSIFFLTFKSFFYHFLDILDFNVDLIYNNEAYIGLLALVLIFISVYQFYAQSYHRIVVPNILHPFLLKLFLPILVLLYYFSFITIDQSVFLFIGFFLFVLFLFIGYTKSQNQLYFTWHPSFITTSLRKEIKSYTFFGSLNSIGSVLAFRIDAIMITLLIGYTSTGQYFLIYFIAGIIEIPLRSINQIAGPLISDLFERNELDEIEKIYKKLSLNLLIFGTFIFLLIWFTMEDLFQLAVDPSKFEYGKQLFVFLGISKLIDMITSVNSYIIIYSKYFRFNVVFVLILGVSNLILNYYLIGEFSLVGAAMATCFSIALYNFIKFIFIYSKFKITPFSRNILKVLLVAGITYGVAFLIPEFSSHLGNIVLKGSVISLIFGTLILGFKVSEDINTLVKDFWTKIKRIL